jgi:hypothetical protein
LWSVDGTVAAADQKTPTELAVVQEWRGDYPVSELHRLPEGQRASHIGYLNNTEQLMKIWPFLKPRQEVPRIDFSTHIVIFTRNVSFYNRTAIAKVMLRDGVAEILAMETMSALPIEDYVAMALAVIPRMGVTAIAAGKEKIPITSNPHGSAVDPLNTVYTVEGNKIALHNGRSEIAIRPDTATRARTFITGNPVAADLDRDGDTDAVAILVHDPGGSGTFYYAAAALNENGRYQGTNAVLLGDRIVPGVVAVRDGVVELTYFDRASDTPMSSEPSLTKRSHLIIDNGILEALPSFGTDEQVFQGWVTIGNEVRTIRPCSLSDVHWLTGDSPALHEIVAQHRETLPHARPYTPLFMVLVAKVVAVPRHGFASEYAAALRASQLVSVLPDGHCRRDFIVVESPRAGQRVSSPLTVRGRARGTWFFEGDFPIDLEDIAGNVISRGYVTAQGDWMTKDFVPFAGTLEFAGPVGTDSANLVLKKDNPTGRPEHDDETRIPIFLR